MGVLERRVENGDTAEGDADETGGLGDAEGVEDVDDVGGEEVDVDGLSAGV